MTSTSRAPQSSMRLYDWVDPSMLIDNDCMTKQIMSNHYLVPSKNQGSTVIRKMPQLSLSTRAEQAVADRCREGLRIWVLREVHHHIEAALEWMASAQSICIHRRCRTACSNIQVHVSISPAHSSAVTAD